MRLHPDHVPLTDEGYAKIAEVMLEALEERIAKVREVVLTPEQQLRAIEKVYPDLVRKPKEK